MRRSLAAVFIAVAVLTGLQSGSVRAETPEERLESFLASLPDGVRSQSTEAPGGTSQLLILVPKNHPELPEIRERIFGHFGFDTAGASEQTRAMSLGRAPAERSRATISGDEFPGYSWIYCGCDYGQRAITEFAVSVGYGKLTGHYYHAESGAYYLDTWEWCGDPGCVGYFIMNDPYLGTHDPDSRVVKAEGSWTTAIQFYNAWCQDV